MTNMHLTNSLNAFMLLQLFNAFAIFMMRQKMMTINDAYIEAAVIDGASMWRIFFKIILPMSGSAMATLAILAFMDMWNDYLLPLVLLSERSKFTLPLLLSTLSGQYKKPSDCLVVEDAEAGVKAALNGGFLVAGIGPAKDCPNVNYPLLSLSELLAVEGHPA